MFSFSNQTKRQRQERDYAMNTNTNKKGFSLLELLIVITIMIVMTTIVVANYYGMSRSSSLTSASTTISNYLLLARQNAITSSKKTIFYIENPTNYSTCSMGEQEISSVSYNNPNSRLRFAFCKFDIPVGTILHKFSFNDYPITVTCCYTGVEDIVYINESGNDITVTVPTTIVGVTDATGWSKEDQYLEQRFTSYVLPNGIVFDIGACSNLSAIIFNPDGTVEGNPSLPYVDGAWQIIVKENINHNSRIVWSIFPSGKIKCHE